MHEASLIVSLLKQVDELVTTHGGGRVRAVRVEVGPLAGVEPVLLNEAFLRLRASSSAAEAELIVDAVALTSRCRACQLEYQSDELRFVCPTCGGMNTELTGGDSFILHSFTLVQSEKAAVAS